MRDTGGNRFIPADADVQDLLAAIRQSLGELSAYDPQRPLDLGAITIDTTRIRNGRISVTVEADLRDGAA